MTLHELLRRTASRLLPVSGEDAPAEARELVSFALGRRIGFADAELEPDAGVLDRLETAIERRLDHEPLQYVIGEWDLMGLTFAVSPAVLIPRQDTETLVIEAERLINERSYASLLDLCTGSGCIGLSLAARTGIAAVLSDISDEALSVARENAARLAPGTECVKSDLFAALKGRCFDIITVNPPYIPSAVIETLSTEVRREPRLALDGGADGLAIYRRIAGEYPEHLNPGGALVMEIGFDQGESVPALFRGHGEVSVTYDLGGNPRAVTVIPGIPKG